MNIHSVASASPLRSPAAPRADKRDAILRAAIDVFAGHGFFNAQVADVARAAGVAAGTVYLYFHGKDDLLVSIFERTMREAIADGRSCIAPLRNPIEQLRAIARVHLDRMGRDRNLAVVFQVELRQSTKFMEQFSSTLLREYLGIIRGILVDGQASGAFRKELNPTLAAKVFFGALDEMATNWILSRRRYALASETDAIVDLFVHGAGVPARARVRGKRSHGTGGSFQEASEHRERATRPERAGEAASEGACRGVRGAKPLGQNK